MALRRKILGPRKQASGIVDNVAKSSSEDSGITDCNDSIAESDIDVATEAGTDTGNGTIDPASIDGSGSDAGTGETPKRRGRKPGTKNRAKEKESASDLTTLLFSMHLMMAQISNCPELALAPEESERLGAAIARVNDEFDGIVISPKAQAIAGLVMAAGSIYGPRFVAVSNRKREERKSKPITIVGK